jgi:hypothetical protein
METDIKAIHLFVFFDKNLKGLLVEHLGFYFDFLNVGVIRLKYLTITPSFVLVANLELGWSLASANPIGKSIVSYKLFVLYKQFQFELLVIVLKG